MNVGSALIAIGTFTSFAAALSKWMSLRSKDKRYGDASAVLAMLTFASITAALVLLMDYFVTSNTGFEYVWSNTSTDLSTTYKLSGVWAGAQGSFLLWIWFMALVLAVEVLLEPRRKYLGAKFHAVFQVALTGVIFAFMLILVNMNLFARTSSFLLEHFPNGQGLSLLLQTPEMVVHPPVVFASYAFCIVAFAASVAYFVTNDRNWFKVTLPWTRLSWIFLTLGIGIGAIWAYYVLGWGGYWAWDPVETSSLLPWLIATAFLHTLVRNAKKREYELAAPILGMLAFVAVVFATFATRAGSLWSSSVHNFGSSVGTSGVSRLSYILNHDGTVLGIFSLMLALAALTVLMAYSKYRERTPPPEGEEPPTISEYISDKNNMLLTVLLLSIVSAVMLLLLFKNVNVSQSANSSEFNQKLSIFFVGLMATMSVCMVWKFIGKRPAFALGSGLIVASIVVAVVAAVTDKLNGLVAFSIPTFAVAIGASGFRLVKSGVPKSLRKTLQNASPHVIHLGVALVLLGYVISSGMQVFPKDAESIQGTKGNVLSVGGELTVSGYTVKLVSLNLRSENRQIGTTLIESAQDAVLDISRSGDAVKSGVTLTNLFGVMNGQEGVVHVEVLIHKSALNDLYLNFQWMSNTTALVQAKVMPLMNVLWGGLALLVIGLALRTVTWQLDAKDVEVPKEDSTQAKRQTPPKKDYSSMVEEDLRRFREKRKR